MTGYAPVQEASVVGVELIDVAPDSPVRRELVPDSGGLLLVTFGYTNCPDICPTTLSELKAALRRLGSDAEHVDVGFVTVDPARDAPDIMRRYVTSFFSDGLALRTDDPRDLRFAADRFGATYEVANSGTASVVSHSASTYVVDSAGDVILVWPFGTTSVEIADDLAVILESQ